MVSIKVHKGDITTMRVDAIVNAANASLLGGGGVDGAIHRAAGPYLAEACLAVRASNYPDGLPTGDAVVTQAFSLPARWVIHTVGPISNYFQGPDHNKGLDLLSEAYRSSLEIATFLNVKTIAFPSISTGAYGWDLQEATATAVSTVESFFALDQSDAPQTIETVTFVAFDDDTYEAFVKALP